MKINDEFYLYAIKERHAFRDKKSLEKERGTKKPKYKLAGKSLSPLTTYSFLLVHSSNSACVKGLTLCIKRNDWEKRNLKYLFHLNKSQSFIDITDCETMDRNELLSKIKNKRKGFPYIAQLCGEKYKELKELTNRLIERQYRERVSEEALAIIVPGLDVADEIKARLGI